MYQYSLQYFKRLFNMIIESSEKSTDLEARIDILLRSITQTIFMNVCRGLFNAHKLIFGFLIAVKILLNRGEITQEEFNLLLKGAAYIPPDFALTENPDPTFFSEKSWDVI
jgi:dynein heavy chain